MQLIFDKKIYVCGTPYIAELISVIKTAAVTTNYIFLIFIIDPGYYI
jgi:hypothetical protein